MGPETGLIIIVALLWGPTAIWLILRASRGSETRRIESRSEPGEEAGSSVQFATGVPVFPPRHWICEGCRSLNVADAKRCYSCRQPRDATAGSPAGDADAATTPIPGPAVTPAGRSTVAMFTLTPEAAAVAKAAVAPAPPLDAPAPKAPVASPSPAAPPAAAVAAAATAAATATADDRRTRRRNGRSAEPAAAAPVTAPFCPFLGLQDDPTTRFDFATPGNVCHSGSAGQAGAPSIKRIVGRVSGTARPHAVDLGQQTGVCLTAAHVDCRRYLAAPAARDGAGTQAVDGAAGIIAATPATPARVAADGATQSPTPTAPALAAPAAPVAASPASTRSTPATSAAGAPRRRASRSRTADNATTSGDQTGQ